MYKVYKITNLINSKIYYGYTSMSLIKRFQGHLGEPRDTIISRSIRKYGKTNFKHELICECNTQADAKFLEKFLIFRDQTNVLQFPNSNGMNMTNGGEGCEGYRHSDELRQQWCKERKGKFAGSKHPNYGKHGGSKKVFQFDKKGKFIKEFPSAKTAGKAVRSCGANISKCCRGITSSVKGFIFSYDKEQLPQRKNPRAVQQFDKEGNFIKEFKSIAQAVRELKLTNRSGIDKCLMGVIKSSQGFVWKKL